jgi:tetratricopeptide (TPR) repeat protein
VGDTSCTLVQTADTEGRLLFTPQRLFGEVGSSPDILAHEPFLERARLQREQGCEDAARLALGGYVVARLVDRLLRLGSDSEAQESFRWQLDAVRRHVDALPPDAPEMTHLTGIIAAVPAGGRPGSSLWMGLTAYAYFLEHEGRLAEALEMLMLAARAQGDASSAADFVSYALTAARLNRQLARWDAANACYGAAEEVALVVGDPVAVLRGRLGKGAVHRGQGNYPLAQAVAQRVVREAEELGLPAALALAYADLGTIYAFQGLRLEALKAHYEAFRLTPDSLQRMRTLGDIALDLCEIGAYGAARVAFGIVINSNTSLLIRLNALLELMDLESSTGNRVAFERCRNLIEGASQGVSPSMATDYQFKLGTGLARFGQLPRAREALQTGLKLAEANGLNAWYFKIEQAVKELPLRQAQGVENEIDLGLSQAPEIDQVMSGLRDYAAVAEP